MYSKTFISVLFSILFALAAVAAPHPDVVSLLSGLLSSAEGDATSVAGDIFGSGIFESITSIGGEVVTIITSEGGKGFTLATSGAGVATSVLGSVYTVATGAIGSQASSLATQTSSSSSAFVPYAGVQAPLLVALGSMLVSALLGMMMTL